MYGGGINDNVAPQILMQRSQKQLVLAAVLPLLHQIAEIWTMKAGNVLVGTTEPELRDDVVPHLPRCARRKGRNRQVREMLAQRAKLTILRAKLVPPFGDAVRLIDGKERNRDMLQPLDRVLAGQAFGREIQ